MNHVQDESYVDRRRLSKLSLRSLLVMSQPLDTMDEQQKFFAGQGEGMKDRAASRATPESKSLGQRLLAALEFSGKSQSDLARALDVGRQAIQQMCAGYNDNPSARRIFKIADVLGVSPRWLALGVGPMTDGEKLKPNEQEMVDLFRSLRLESQSEVIGFARGLGGNAKSATAQALERFITDMSEDDAKRLAGLLTLVQKARPS
jgi:transcriptional regulator with XRE-family HTH domain